MERARRLLSIVDLTSLNDQDDEGAIIALARAACTPHGNVAAVCTWPRLTRVAAAALQGTGVPVAAVVNFPAGIATPGEVALETMQAVRAGAGEIDLVLPWRALLENDQDAVRDLLRACRESCGAEVILKVILETGQLRTPERISLAAEIAIKAGADFIKTSTGRTQPGATLEAAKVMLEAIASARERGRVVGFKASGGVRSAEAAAAYVDLYDARFGEGAAGPDNFRIGASSLMVELRTRLDLTEFPTDED